MTFEETLAGAPQRLAGEPKREDRVTTSRQVSAADLAHALSCGVEGEVDLVPHEDGPAVTLRPQNAVEVSRAVTIAAKLGARVAATRRARPGLVALNLDALSDIEAPDERSCVIRTGSGVRVREVEDRAIQSGLSLGALLPSSANKKLGAWLAGPTRGERAIPADRLETAALALEAVLPDGSFYRSKETPRSAVGPDLDYLLLGGEGRFGIITQASLRLFPRAVAEGLGMRAALTALDAIEGVHKAVQEGLWPSEARWERGRKTVEVRFVGVLAGQRARRFGSGPIEGQEHRGDLELAGSWRAWKAISPLRPQVVQLVAIHGDGAFGSVVFESAEQAERAAEHARAIGFSVVSPRRLRATLDSGFRAAGALSYYEALAKELDPLGVFAF